MSRETGVGRGGRKEEEGRRVAQLWGRAKGLPCFGKAVRLLFYSQTFASGQEVTN